ncbi:MAG: MaoC family dehydratase N-terminal domain-containing protein [Acidimicrobiales bacterium]|nr:MaoC family dehydratase N-terminal domain-containing protein [Acidimicrobiales bacterium]
MAMYLHRIGATSAPSRHTWSPAQCALYALSVGATPNDTSFAIDRPGGLGQDVYPSFVFAGVLAAASASWPDPGFSSGDYDIHQIVLGEQGVELHTSVPAVGDVTAQTRLAAIHDKGSGALVTLETRATDNTTHQPMFTATTTLFISGEGGFGGDRGPAGAAPIPPDRPPDRVDVASTSPVQTLLYRYAGNDRNPIHADPEVAWKAGYREPILMGQNVLGFACRALVAELAGGRPNRLRSVSGRFAKAGYNRDTLVTECWVGDDVGVDSAGNAVVAFRVRTPVGDVLVDRGRATIAP